MLHIIPLTRVFFFISFGGINVVESIESIKIKVKILEDRVNSLRLGRRILMNLLIEQEHSKNLEIKRLTNEIKRLKRILKYSR